MRQNLKLDDTQKRGMILGGKAMKLDKILSIPVALMILLAVTMVPTMASSPNNDQAILIQGIEDYLTGKTDKLPAYNEYPGSGAVDINYIEKRHAPMPLPLRSGNTSISSASLNGLASIPSRSVYDPALVEYIYYVWWT